MITITIIGAMLFCMLLYRFATYAVPAYLGFASAFWTFGLGAGAGGLVIGISVALGAFTLARRIAANGNLTTRLLVTALFAIPAGYTAYCIVMQLSEIAVSSMLWRYIFAIIGAFLVGATAALRLTGPPAN
jgi:hypothetical protein